MSLTYLTFKTKDGYRLRFFETEEGHMYGFAEREGEFVLRPPLMYVMGSRSEFRLLGVPRQLQAQRDHIRWMLDTCRVGGELADRALLDHHGFRSTKDEDAIAALTEMPWPDYDLVFHPLRETDDETMALMVLCCVPVPGALLRICLSWGIGVQVQDASMVPEDRDGPWFTLTPRIVEGGGWDNESMLLVDAQCSAFAAWVFEMADWGVRWNPERRQKQNQRREPQRPERRRERRPEGLTHRPMAAGLSVGTSEEDTQ